MGSIQKTGRAAMRTVVLAAVFGSMLLTLTALTPLTAAAERVVDSATDTPEVGGKAPDFTLATSDGTKRTLSDQRGRTNVVLVFFRGPW